MDVVRYVNMSFIGAALVCWVILAEFSAWIMSFMGRGANPELLGEKFRLADVVGIAVASGLVFYLKKKYGRQAMEIGNELAKVTWPTWKETKMATIVVIIVTIIIALILGAFDYVWAQLSSLVYNIKGG